ncbi:EsV-1-7 [Ectocarpus siliculosus]|uniref:EsV-1-7 n=1 Tax=Ectocarpus siliculosus TaxID=2880 RepID=D8LMB1_ECTSI|nr:EsV-1-7 [Ectocarpus siliculosus]|eukprot:CBN77521.1 EsV-1-7 [Ectocarpus siliculosus]
MVDVVNRRCRHPGCTKRPSFGQDGSKKQEFCAQHAHQGMVDIVSKRCARPGCMKQPRFGNEGSKKPEFCAQHAPQDMVDVLSKRCAHPGCTKGYIRQQQEGVLCPTRTSGHVSCSY